MKRLVLVALGFTWACAIVAGLIVLWDYETGPAPAGAPPVRWPQASRLPSPVSHARLVLAAHPQCPCTRATIGELERVLARSAGRLDAYVLFYRPDGVAEGWERTDLWWRAAAIPGVRVLRDDRGEEAERFGALASGQAMLYGADGVLLFRGGITASRGHAGDNPGAEAIISLVHGESTARTLTPVFGCTLRDVSGPRPAARGGIAYVRQIVGRLGIPVGLSQ